jgi:hypothetical protein
LALASAGSQALWLAFGFCQKQKQLKAPTKGTLNVTSHINLTIYFLTLRNFIGDGSISKHRTWQNVYNSFNFLLQPLHMISWDTGKSHNFQTLFAIFKIFKSFGHTIMVVLLGQNIQTFFWFHENVLNWAK